MSFDGNEAEQFPLDEAAKWTANYRAANPQGVKAHFFGKNILQDILNQPGCMGIRVYYALDDDGKQQMIMVGANADENDMFNDIIAEKAKPCPPFCDKSGSPLL